MGLAGKIKNPSSGGYDYPPAQQSTAQYGSGGHGVASPQQQSVGPYGSDSYGVAAQQQPTGPYGNGKSPTSGYGYPPQQQSTGPYGAGGHQPTGPYGSASNGKSSSSRYDYPSQQQSTGPYGSGGYGYGQVSPQQQPSGPYGSATGPYGSAGKSKNSSSGYDYPPQQQSTGPYGSGGYGQIPSPQQPTGPYGSAGKNKNGYDYPPQQQSTGPYGSGSYGGTPPPQQPTGSFGSDFYYGSPAQYASPSPSAPPRPQQTYGAPYEHTRPPSLVESSPYGVQGQTSPYPGQAPPGTQGMYSPTPAGTTALPGSTQPVLAQKLQSIIQANGLQAFYDPGRLQATLQRVSTINFAEIAAQWKIDRELAYDLAPLALYDIVFYCDDSGSMAFEENGERIDDLRFILSKVAGIATRFDDDGIRVRFMNSEVNGDGINSAASVEQLVSRVRFSGLTPLGTNLERKVVEPFVLGPAMSSMVKPVLAIIITDGEPSGEGRGKIREVIQHAKDALMRTRYGGGAFAVQIAQVGKDAKTQKFLEALDKDPVVGGMIDCTSYYELEEQEFARKGVTLTPELWLLKMCVGAIDPEYDSKDT